jgi:hypothetical protein
MRVHEEFDYYLYMTSTFSIYNRTVTSIDMIDSSKVSIQVEIDMRFNINVD